MDQIVCPSKATANQLNAWAKKNDLQLMQHGAHTSDAISVMKNGVPYTLATYKRNGNFWYLVESMKE